MENWAMNSNRRMNLRIIAYNALVNQVPEIRERYESVRGQVHGVLRIKAWIYLIRLNIYYYIFKNEKLTRSRTSYYEEKKLYALGSESELFKKEDPELFSSKLMQYKVISFDVFDTLIFRPFSKPADLFYLIAEKLGYPDFERIRQELEWKAREKCDKEKKHREVTLNDIYEFIFEETDISKEEGIQAELNAEYDMCFSNPYMLKVVWKLKKNNKRIIVTSDMYLNTKQIREILTLAGYPEFDAYYVSSEQGKTKGEGSLYQFVKEKEKIKEKFDICHVGDNVISDIDQAEKQGITSFYYRNVNQTGMMYRAEDMSAITGSIYRGIVNSHLHNGLGKYTREYEFGFIYGGLFVTGYCHFIHEYVKKHGIDKILFLARDGDILMQAYKRMYPSEKEHMDYDYVYWSRLAALKMTAVKYKYDYFRRFLYHKVNQGYTLYDIMCAMELEDMLEELCWEAEQEKMESVTPNSRLTDKNVNVVKKYLLKNWQKVTAHYEQQITAGKHYYEPILKECKKAVAVDIGWAGSGALMLSYLIKDVWKFDCDVIGILAGTNTCHNAEPNISEPQLKNGKLVSYLYSQEHNRDLWKLHNAGKGHNLYWELLLSSTKPTFKGFYFESGKVQFAWGRPEKFEKEIQNIQEGILDFVSQYWRFAQKYSILEKISGRDAYAAMILVETENREYVNEVIIPFLQEENVGG